jgi:hypothetical protein
MLFLCSEGCKMTHYEPRDNPQFTLEQDLIHSQIIE